MENEIVEALNRNTAMVQYLAGLINDLLNKKTVEKDWYDSIDTMEMLKIGEKTLQRMRKHHPGECKKVMGKWYYNITLLMIHKR